MHLQLARRLSISERLTVRVSYRQRVLRHTAFADHGWRRHNATVVQTYTDIAIGRNNVAPLIQQLADVYDFPTSGQFIHNLIKLYYNSCSLNSEICSN